MCCVDHVVLLILVVITWSISCSSGRFVTVDSVVEVEEEEHHQEAPEGEGRGAAPRGEADGRGVLLSPLLDQEDWSCLRLVYQITGAGGLEVLLRSEGKGFDRPLWSSQEPSDSWVISSMDLPNTTEPYRVNSFRGLLLDEPLVYLTLLWVFGGLF